MGFGADHGKDEKKTVAVSPLSSMLRDIYRPMLRFQFPEYDELVAEHGEDAVWEALGKIGQEEMRRETGLPL